MPGRYLPHLAAVAVATVGTIVVGLVQGYGPCDPQTPTDDREPVYALTPDSQQPSPEAATTTENNAATTTHATVCQGQSPITAVEADRARIRQHFEGVDRVLRGRDVSHLSPDQRANRERLLQRLAAYREASEFPRNAHHPGRLQPYFIDDDNRKCAVADLMIASGHQALAERVRQQHNHEYVLEMRTEGLSDWAQTYGFTVEELALIQPGYCVCENDADFNPVCAEDGLTYWNACAASHCAGVPVAHEGECVHEDRECAPPYVSKCGGGISHAICDPKGGNGASGVFKHEAEAMLADGTCAESNGCACTTSGGSGTGLKTVGFAALVVACGWRRRRNRHA